MNKKEVIGFFKQDRTYILKANWVSKNYDQELVSNNNTLDVTLSKFLWDIHYNDKK